MYKLLLAVSAVALLAAEACQPPCLEAALDIVAEGMEAKVMKLDKRAAEGAESVEGFVKRTIPKSEKKAKKPKKD